MARLLIATTMDITLRAFLFPFAQHFRTQGWRVDAMARGSSRSPECIRAFDQVWEAQWSRYPLNQRNLLNMSRYMRAVVETEKYDLVHVHTPVAAFVARYALRKLRRSGIPKVIYTAHGFHFYQGGNPFKNRAFLGIERLAGRWTDYLVVINREDEQAAKTYHIVPSDRVWYMPGIGVNTAYYNRDAVTASELARVREELGVTKDAPLFLMVAEFSPGKRHRDALMAFARLKRANAHLAFAGPGPLMGKMQQLASNLGLNGRVHFLGFRRDIPVLMRASVATLLPSEREGLPRSVMESLLLEVPVIGTNIRGTRDLLAGGGGLMVEVGDVEELAKSMSWILDHPEEALAMGRQGRLQIETNYDQKHILTLHEALYAEALKEI